MRTCVERISGLDWGGLDAVKKVRDEDLATYARISRSWPSACREPEK